jgi:hypothetical protein
MFEKRSVISRFRSLSREEGGAKVEKNWKKRKKKKDRRWGLTVRLFPVDSGAGIGGRRREYDLAPDAVPVGGRRRRRGRRCRCVGVDRPEDRVDERV